MKKSNFVSLILGFIGILCLGLGMSMTSISEWNMFNEGIIVGAIGILVLLINVIVYRKMEGKEPIKFSAKILGRIFVALLGTLGLGIGMSLVMVYNNFILGITIGVIGIIILLCLVPMIKGLK